MFFIDKSTSVKEEFQETLTASLNSMYNLAYRLTNNREAAGDLVQEASLRAYRFYDKFEKGTNFKAWILTILRNIFINEYRKRAKEPHKVDYETVENYIKAPHMTGAEEEIFGEEVQKALNTMPEDLRTVLTLFYVEDLKYKEIAQIMKCPVGTVMSRLFMARQMLKKKLSQSAKREV